MRNVLDVADDRRYSHAKTRRRLMRNTETDVSDLRRAAPISHHRQKTATMIREEIIRSGNVNRVDLLRRRRRNTLLGSCRRPSCCLLLLVTMLLCSPSSFCSQRMRVPLIVEGYSFGSLSAIHARGYWIMDSSSYRQRPRDTNERFLHLPLRCRKQTRRMLSTSLSSPEQEQNFSIAESSGTLLPRQHNQHQHNDRIRHHLNDHRYDSHQTTSPEVSYEEQQHYYDWDMSLSSFNMDLQNLAMEDPIKAEDAVDVMHELYLKNPDSAVTVQPDATCYTIVMDGYIQAGKLEQAQAVIDKMERLAVVDSRGAEAQDCVSVSPIAPTGLTYILMAQAWANDFKEDFTGTSAENAVDIMRRMQAVTTQGMLLSSGRSGSNAGSPEAATSSLVKVWMIVVEGWCKRAGIARQAMQQADKLLLEMEDCKQTLVHPNVLAYTSYVGGLSRCKENDMARKAESVLERMERHNVHLDMVAYTAVINCWAKAVSRRERSMAATRALSILGEMERMYISKKMYSAKPSLITYATVIAAIGNSLDPAAPQLAEGVLQRMQKLQVSGAIANLKPGTVIYNAVIYALSRAPVSNRLRYAQRAEQILDEMSERAQQGEKDVQPDVRTWSAVLRAWTRSKQPDAAENAQRVLDKMEYRYKKGISTVRPNYVCYTTVMGAWGRSQSKNNLDKMEHILRRMEESYEATSEPDIRPNTVSYVTCIDAFVRKNKPDAAQRAQATVDRMIQLYAKGFGHVRPTRTVFNVLIHAWSRSKERGAAQNAEKIFQWMEAQHRAGDDLVRPDEFSLCAVLNAWANQAEYGGAERAQHIWEHTDSVSSNELGFRPTIAMPNIVIKAIARSKDPDAVSKAERILLRLEEDYRSGKSFLRPDVTTYSSVINACAYCVGDASKRAEALDTALRTFYKLCDMEHENANNITYGTIFKAIQNLMPPTEDRDELVRDLFDQCCEGGFVDYFVLSQVRYASPLLYRELVEGPCGLGGPGSKYGLEAVLKNIPTEWAANVVE